MIEKYLSLPYVDYGRDMRGCDCWGLVRLVRRELRGDVWPLYGGIHPDAKRALTRATQEFTGTLREVQAPAEGALATTWRGVLCLHVGVVVKCDGRLGVLETGRQMGVRWLSMGDFKRRYLTVRFHDD